MHTYTYTCTDTDTCIYIYINAYIGRVKPLLLAGCLDRSKICKRVSLWRHLIARIPRIVWPSSCRNSSGICIVSITLFHFHETIMVQRLRESFLSHRPTPSYHPFRTMGVSLNHPAIKGYPHDELETPRVTISMNDFPFSLTAGDLGNLFNKWPSHHGEIDV